MLISQTPRSLVTHTHIQAPGAPSLELGLNQISAEQIQIWLAAEAKHRCNKRKEMARKKKKTRTEEEEEAVKRLTHTYRRVNPNDLYHAPPNAHLTNLSLPPNLRQNPESLQKKQKKQTKMCSYTYSWYYCNHDYYIWYVDQILPFLSTPPPPPT